MITIFLVGEWTSKTNRVASLQVPIFLSESYFCGVGPKRKCTVQNQEHVELEQQILGTVHRFPSTS